MQQPKCRRLVLDAGPLLSLSPLRGLAETYLTVPQVLAELKDSRAREHFERLGLLSGVKVEVRSPDAASLALVIQWAKKTGDYSVLSHPDLCVLALTYLLDEEDKKAKTEQKGQTQSGTASAKLDETSLREAEFSAEVDLEPATEELHEDDQTTSQDLEQLDVELVPINNETSATLPQSEASTSGSSSAFTPLYEDPLDSDDGEGEWITPDNVGIHKSKALDLLPNDGLKNKGKKAAVIGSGCMTADFAMQNVLLQMGLNLVGLEGKRIEKVKSWVLRCHACFKICKDNSKKFCPSCGNPTLLRASVTVAVPNASANAPIMQVHLKPNFRYKTRGTKYSIPQPKPGSAKTGPGTGLILREDQVEYMRAKKRADGKREREEEKVVKGILARGIESNGTGVSSWMDPDWVPEIISVGSGGKGRTIRNSRMDGDMPQIGYGRKNPNEKRRKK
ncbi:Nin one binding Zn-ribbon like-domain-containing protein [Gymnopilus junonius]|uniref:20S-pre-rRNA D-site endonuclease NOB1 n=1 Tax=Gymnopilus junonius TaxID=109634 RepID=A0A9P5TVA0_GYMJU|nr:Nin one binding Zn-ribbon like-domain-containing protein [Gymnopilus junonius]